MGHASLGELRSNFVERVTNGDLMERQTSLGRSFTTPEMVALEGSNIRRMQEGRGQTAPLATTHHHFEHLRPGQRKAVEAVLASRDQILGLQGVAGAGKTTSLAAIRVAAEQEGYTVQGLAPTSRAAHQLEAAGMRSQTLQHHLAQGARAHESAAKRLYFLDESSLASTRQMHEFFDRLGPNERVLLVGDTRQHQAVDAGKPFEQLQAAGMRTARLDEIVRQKEEGLKHVVEQLARGAVREAIGELQQQGRVHEVSNRDARLREIARSYAASTVALVLLDQRLAIDHCLPSQTHLAVV
jgi:ATP-dependent exoDNAse (exonuclease V) alpha subunit